LPINKRWIPSIAAPAVIASAAVLAPVQAVAVDLPDLTAQEVMLLVNESSNVKAFSGSITKTTNLGLPALELSSMVTPEMVEKMEEKMPEGFEDFTPQVLEQSAFNDAISLIAGTHDFRVYVSELGMRVQLKEMMGERDLIITEESLIFYDFDSNTVQIVALPEGREKPTAEQLSEIEDLIRNQVNQLSVELQLDLSSPEAVAEAFLAEAGKNTTITVGSDHRVAGRTAYQLIATPISDYSTVDSVEVSVDSETGFILDSKVFAKGMDEPAIHVGFTSISYDIPDADLFSFVSPPGATVIEMNPAESFAELTEPYSEELKQLSAGLQTTDWESIKESFSGESNPTRQQAEAALAELTNKYLLGQNWDTVLKVPNMAGKAPMDLLDNPVLADMLTDVAGGQAFTTPLVNVLLTDDGDVYMGAVSLDYLVALSQ